MQPHHRRRSSKSIRTNTPVNYARRMTVHLPETIPDTTYLYGYALLGASFFFFTFSVYSIVASEYMPDVHIKFLDWVKYDDYYCLLIPITAIVWIYWVLWNWMGMKFFRHN
ncbi:phosphatidylinositol N-acetylglucosaminyltransferase subunit Y-domain-containing protein [Gilbertella persicaria]|uniref:phosphatidylinositol N-acetylglucosaminyltransferase subunit Y-domain-containing protein n=1 Tax=Gilbertella persicaria TaxID=101096 RepID=UPI002221294E|nr:phosphatidylinositol N-acetylglucosaminyltransferase subunit Y-domain-containing protein [Gilbertella persicaria]KAI8090215.1 phosphatidylinositol N-acetylglucosaminyltransferase subunit Y-domain-containing protein [Gilbertella persicaria]